MSRLPDLDALQLLVAVADTGSLGKAAARSGISQPSASARMATLERRLGLKLLERTPSGSRLTGDGAVVTDWARRVLEQAEALVEGAEALRVHADERLSVAASLTIAEHLVPKWLIELRQLRPATRVGLTVANSHQVVAALRAAEAELGFVEGPWVPRDLHSVAVGRDRLAVVVAPAHPWARLRRPLTAAQLAAEPLLLRETGSGTRDVLEAALAAHDGLTVPLIELGATAPLRSAALAGSGPAVLSVLAVAEDIAAGRLVEVPVAEEVALRRTLRAVWLRGRELGDAAGWLVRVAQGRV
ncbi:LysR family transcriptional regulator [Catenulispora yoronensis]|uniref:LysR family transcriptional regulator n=1 Tax=Catenulispora yoronensis TaxID=450799 RepID=A0ABN2V660_9ACTN